MLLSLTPTCNAPYSLLRRHVDIRRVATPYRHLLIFRTLQNDTSYEVVSGMVLSSFYVQIRCCVWFYMG